MNDTHRPVTTHDLTRAIAAMDAARSEVARYRGNVAKLEAQLADELRALDVVMGNLRDAIRVYNNRLVALKPIDPAEPEGET